MISATHLHAMVIHFPIALILVGFLAELIATVSKKDFFKTAAMYLLLLGALGAIIAYISGSYAGEGIEEGPLKEPLELHQTAATITLWLSVVLALFKGALTFFKYNKKWTKIFVVILFTGLAAAVGTTGYLGGQLVYKHAAGVELALPDFGTDFEIN